jgi:hypothetical protein
MRHTLSALLVLTALWALLIGSVAQAQHGFLDPTAERPVPVALDWGMSLAEVDSALGSHY